MKECPKCGENHNKNGKFCSRACANSRTWSEEDKKKKSESAKKSEKVKLTNSNRSKETYIKMVKTKVENHRKKILESNYNDLSFDSLRFRILYEQNEKCNNCGLEKWLGEPITLELEHKDGNNQNNERSNLEILCPNCHALTDTWRGRNKFRKNKARVPDEKLFNALLSNEWNMRQALIEVGLSPKGGNYKRCHKLKREFDEHL